jgi:hypothetical protein
VFIIALLAGFVLFFRLSSSRDWKIIYRLTRCERSGQNSRIIGVILISSTFKLKLTNTSMMMCKASVIDYLLVTDIFCCVMFICTTKEWNDLQLFGFAKLTYFVML